MVLVVKNLPVNAGDIRDTGLIPRLGRSSEGGHGNPLQYSCLENPMERGAWQTTVHRVAKSCPWLNWFSTQAYLYPHPLETPFHPKPHSTHLRHHRALVELPVLYSSFPLANCFTHGSAYTSVLLSNAFQVVLPPPLQCPYVHSLQLHLYSWPANSSSVPFS